MNVTATLIGQMITFGVLIWFVKQYLWGPMMAMLEDRKQRIADGLAAAERGAKEQALAEEKAAHTLRESKQEAQEIISQAQKRAQEIVEQAQTNARAEGDRIKASAQAEIDQQVQQAKEQLRKEVGTLALAGAEKILKRQIDANAHSDVLNELATQI